MTEFDQILDTLDSGAKEAIESKDYLSYSTLLDIYLNEVDKYSNEEKEQLLDHLLKILKENDQLTYEIGWDIPQLLMLYIESDYKFDAGIRQAPCVYKVVKIFEVLAFKGNAKELFLKSCEVLSGLGMDNSDDENFFEIKLHCIYELVDSSLKKIHTLYPSRFLALAISSFINMVHRLIKNDITIGNSHFVMKRAYSFARGYNSLPVPKNDLSKEELEKIEEDENYLQRKLLTSFITQVVYLFGTIHTEGVTLTLFKSLKNDQQNDNDEEDKILDRYAELALSFDIYPEKKFNKFVTESHDLFDKLNLANDDISADMFEKVVVDYQTNVLTSLTDSEAKTINDSIIGILSMYTSQVLKSKKFDSPTVTFSDVIVLSLRVMIPQMVNPVFKHLAMQDFTMFWAWFSLHQQGKKVELQIAQIPKLLITTYFQVLLFSLSLSDKRPNARYIILTLLTKLLTLTPEAVGYDFIKDSLVNCPYENVKAALIGVYKVLLLKVRDVDISNLSLDLPKRDHISKKYYQLTEEKLDDLLQQLLIAQTNAFIKKDEVGIDPSKLSTLAAYLNLFVGIKREPIIIEQKEKINKVIESVVKNIQSVTNKKDKSNQFEQNAAGMLELSIERFQE